MHTRDVYMYFMCIHVHIYTPVYVRACANWKNYIEEVNRNHDKVKNLIANSPRFKKFKHTYIDSKERSVIKAVNTIILQILRMCLIITIYRLIVK